MLFGDRVWEVEEWAIVEELVVVEEATQGVSEFQAHKEIATSQQDLFATTESQN